MAERCEMICGVERDGDLAVQYARCENRAAYRVRRYGRTIGLCRAHKEKWFNRADVVAQL